jgi:hypothetical protein
MRDYVPLLAMGKVTLVLLKALLASQQHPLVMYASLQILSLLVSLVKTAGSVVLRKTTVYLSLRKEPILPPLIVHQVVRRTLSVLPVIHVSFLGERQISASLIMG